ncbi:MAG: zinc ribbon domain-containing protein [Actinomycetota bacterium]
MKSGICPKCGESEVYGDHAKTHGLSVIWTAILPAHTILLACANCGYLEFYIENEKDLAKVKKNFQKIES